MSKTIYVEGMTCGHCKMKVEASLSKLDEVNSAEVDLIEGSVELDLKKDIEEGKLSEVLKEAGYKLVKVES